MAPWVVNVNRSLSPTGLSIFKSNTSPSRGGVPGAWTRKRHVVSESTRTLGIGHRISTLSPAALSVPSRSLSRKSRIGSWTSPVSECASTLNLAPRRGVKRVAMLESRTTSSNTIEMSSGKPTRRRFVGCTGWYDTCNLAGATRRGLRLLAGVKPVSAALMRISVKLDTSGSRPQPSDPLPVALKSVPSAKHVVRSKQALRAVGSAMP